MKPEVLEEPGNHLCKKILVWYINRWLPIAVGSEYWDVKYRHFKLMTDTIKMRTGEEKVLCTVTSKAFGLMVYDNCRDKWLNIMNLKKANTGKF